MRIRATLWACALAAGCAASTGDGADDGARTPGPGATPGSDDAPSPPDRDAIPVHGARGTPGVLADHDAVVYVADADNGEVVRIDRDALAIDGLPVGDTPTRMVRIGDDLFVTLRMAGEVVRVRDGDAGLTEIDRWTVGAEPYGIAASPGSDTLYVALSQEEAVVALDATTLVETDRWTVRGEPRWLVVAPAETSGSETLFVLPARARRVVEIDVATGDMRPIALPMPQRFADPRCPNRPLTPRITGDGLLAPDGRLMVPVLYVDTMLPPGAPSPLEVRGGDDGAGDAGDTPWGDTGAPSWAPPPFDPPSGVPDCEETPQPPGPAYYAQPADPGNPGKPGRLTPSVVVIDTTPGGALETVSLGAAEISTFQNQIASTALRSYPSGLAWVETPGGPMLASAMPGASALLLAQVDVPGQPVGASTAEPMLLASWLRTGVAMDAGASAVRWVPGRQELVVWSFLDRTVSFLGALGGVTEAMPLGVTATRAAIPRPWRVALRGSSLSPELQRGRRLFYAADDSRLSRPGSGTSCETCHTDGRNDGITWIFQDFPRQTPSLGGPVSQTAPFTWKGVVDTVIDEIHATSRVRMGGRGLDTPDAEALVAFVESTPAPVRPTPVGPAREAAVRGARVFARDDVGCADCHGGDAFTDGEQHRVFGFDEPTDTPTLLGIGGSAPYLHDGSSPTLRDVVIRAGDGAMGTTAHLSDTEIDDLVAFLQTL